MARRSRVPFGRTYYISTSFALPDGMPYEPGAVNFWLRDPDGPTVMHTLDSGGVQAIGGGTYRVIFQADKPGLWRYWMEGRDLGFEAVLDPPGEIIVTDRGVN